ncbi:peroxisome- protein [Gaertneriomyces sp. JEL0708]|nr:peroxisome- protein [Gaertneriomyces sp. JEL0708]
MIVTACAYGYAKRLSGKVSGKARTNRTLDVRDLIQYGMSIVSAMHEMLDTVDAGVALLMFRLKSEAPSLRVFRFAVVGWVGMFCAETLLGSVWSLMFAGVMALLWGSEVGASIRERCGVDRALSNIFGDHQVVDRKRWEVNEIEVLDLRRQLFGEKEKVKRKRKKEKESPRKPSPPSDEAWTPGSVVDNRIIPSATLAGNDAEKNLIEIEPPTHLITSNSPEPIPEATKPDSLDTVIKRCSNETTSSTSSPMSTSSGSSSSLQERLKKLVAEKLVEPTNDAGTQENETQTLAVSPQPTFLVDESNISVDCHPDRINTDSEPEPDVSDASDDDEDLGETSQEASSPRSVMKHEPYYMSPRSRNEDSPNVSRQHSRNLSCDSDTTIDALVNISRHSYMSVSSTRLSLDRVQSDRSGRLHEPRVEAPVRMDSLATASNSSLSVTSVSSAEHGAPYWTGADEPSHYTSDNYVNRSSQPALELPPPPSSGTYPAYALRTPASVSSRSSLRAANRKATPLCFIYETYENQRWWVGMGWVPHLLPTERGPWTDITGSKALTKTSFQLPPWREGCWGEMGVDDDVVAELQLEDGRRFEWGWEGPWCIDTGNLAEKSENSDEAAIDAEGWSYADNFWSGWKNRRTLKRVVRRRRWYRVVRLYEIGWKRSVTFGGVRIVETEVENEAPNDEGNESDNDYFDVHPAGHEVEESVEQTSEMDRAKLWRTIQEDLEHVNGGAAVSERPRARTFGGSESGAVDGGRRYSE